MFVNYYVQTASSEHLSYNLNIYRTVSVYYATGNLHILSFEHSENAYLPMHSMSLEIVTPVSPAELKAVFSININIICYNIFIKYHIKLKNKVSITIYCG